MVPKETRYWLPCQAIAQTFPDMAESFSVNPFLPEAVIISRSLARVMPRMGC